MSNIEAQLIAKLAPKCAALGLPSHEDLRGKLAVNPAGRKFGIRNPSALQGLVVHQEAGWGSVESVATYHTGKTSHLAAGGTQAIAYSLAVRRNGAVCICSDFTLSTWSQGDKSQPGDENSKYIAVMFEGLFNAPGIEQSDAGEPNAAQISALMALWSACRETWGWSDADIFGHFDFGKPTCPGSTLAALIRSIRAGAPIRDSGSFDFRKIKDRQRALATLGYLTGVPDGVWGPKSSAALQRLQTDSGLTADGIWGPKTERRVLELISVRLGAAA